MLKVVSEYFSTLTIDITGPSQELRYLRLRLHQKSNWSIVTLLIEEKTNRQIYFKTNNISLLQDYSFSAALFPLRRYCFHFNYLYFKYQGASDLKQGRNCTKVNLTNEIHTYIF